MAHKQVKIPEMFLRGMRKRTLAEASEPEHAEASKMPLLSEAPASEVASAKKPKIEAGPLESSKENAPAPLIDENAPYEDKLVATLRDPSWKRVLKDELKKTYMKEVFKFLADEEKKKVKVFPPRDLIFNAFNLTPFREVKVVVLGQDPYHNDRQAHGLCFSVQKGIPAPPSLVNIYKELQEDIPSFAAPSHGCLDEWAKQGIFLLNATLTVEAHKANSHSGIGWQQFTDATIKLLSAQRDKLVFLLWGAFAHKKEALIDKKKHAIVKAAHPSPLSYHRFKGCKCFSQVNDHLKKFSKQPINWNCL